MSWTVACFCGAVFEHPAESCPTCHTPVPDVTRGANAIESKGPSALELELLLAWQEPAKSPVRQG